MPKNYEIVWEDASEDSELKKNKHELQGAVCSRALTQIGSNCSTLRAKQQTGEILICDTSWRVLFWNHSENERVENGRLRQWLKITAKFYGMDSAKLWVHALRIRN